MSNNSDNINFTCKACGKEVAAGDVRRCEICLKKRCPGCVIEIAGKTVCTDCKDWTLSKMEEGLPLKPDGMLFASAAEISSKRKEERARRLRGTSVEQRERRAWQKAIGSEEVGCFRLIAAAIVGFIVATLMVGIGYPDGFFVFLGLLVFFTPVYYWIYRKSKVRGQVMLFHLDDSGVEAQTFAGAQIFMTWTEIDRIVLGAKSFTVGAPGRRIRLRKNMFTHYNKIREEVLRKAREKGTAVIGYKYSS